MSDRGRQCPFINRGDERCAAHFRLDHLDEALGLCCAGHQTCRTYYELLVERRLRHVAAPAGKHGAADAVHPPVQLTIAPAVAKPLRHVA